MGRRPSRFTEAELCRAAKAAKRAGMVVKPGRTGQFESFSQKAKQNQRVALDLKSRRQNRYARRDAPSSSAKALPADNPSRGDSLVRPPCTSRTTHPPALRIRHTGFLGGIQGGANRGTIAAKAEGIRLSCLALGPLQSF